MGGPPCAIVRDEVAAENAQGLRVLAVEANELPKDLQVARGYWTAPA
jgi:hypothetical protein